MPVSPEGGLEYFPNIDSHEESSTGRIISRDIKNLKIFNLHSVLWVEVSTWQVKTTWKDKTASPVLAHLYLKANALSSKRP